jgi:Domain of Unknown Function (DUF1080)
MLGTLLWLLASCSSPSEPGGAQQASTSVIVTSLTQSPGPSTTSTAAAVGATPPPATNTAPLGAASPSAVSRPAAASGASPARWNFDSEPIGSVPAGAQVFSGQWAVRAEPDAPSPPNALCQTGQAEYPAIGLDARPYTDLTLVTRFKPISGQEDQAGGLIFRVQDRDNYYIARGNALEDNVIFFVYVGARRSQLKAGNAKVMNGVWHELRVEVRGNVFTASLDGKQVVDVADDRYKSGGIGLWTKSDSVTCFDDVEVVSA